ncbi:MAG TPA: hypothetical protein VFI31_11010, partial [Pirellulales bacterium]|nr:hypothetical protein [Pirellulales bacterium]
MICCNISISGHARGFFLFLAISAFGACASSLSAGDEQASGGKLGQIVNKGLEYLRQKGQAEDGSFSSQAGPGVTSLVATAALRNGRTRRDPVVAKSLQYLENFAQPDGGIYAPNRRVPN